MSDESPKYTENSFKSMADAAIDSARTKAVIDVRREEGRSDRDIIKDIFNGEDGFKSLARTVKIINLWKWMGEVFDLPLLPSNVRSDGNINRVFYGYLLIMRHYVDEPEAKKVQDLFNNAKTIRDLWVYFLECNDISEEQVMYLPGYDHWFFKDLLSKEISLKHGFGINSEEALKKKG